MDSLFSILGLGYMFGLPNQDDEALYWRNAGTANQQCGPLQTSMNHAIWYQQLMQDQWANWMKAAQHQMRLQMQRNQLIDDVASQVKE